MYLSELKPLKIPIERQQFVHTLLLHCVIKENHFGSRVVRQSEINVAKMYLLEHICYARVILFAAVY